MGRALLTIVALLLVTRSAAAGPVTIVGFELERDGSFGSGRVEIGADSALISIPVFSACVGAFGAPCESGPGAYRPLRGTMQLQSGPLTQMTPLSGAGLENTYYEYGESGLRLDLEWDAPGGAVEHGALVFSLPQFAFTVVGENVTGDSDYPFIFEAQPLGAGTIDRELAAYLGVARTMLDGHLFWWVEPVLGTPGAPRVGHSYTPQFAVAVPEPGLGLLAALALAAGIVRARRR